jgi:hypothetical protein
MPDASPRYTLESLLIVMGLAFACIVLIIVLCNAAPAHTKIPNEEIVGADEEETMGDPVAEPRAR